MKRNQSKQPILIDQDVVARECEGAYERSRSTVTESPHREGSMEVVDGGWGGSIVGPK